MPIYSNMPEDFYPRPADVNSPLRSILGIGPRGPKGHSVTAEVIDTDPYGYFRIQFKDVETDEVLAITPNLDVGSRFYVCTEDYDDVSVGGALVVGTGFPQVCVEREILKQYFDEKGESGFDYAYRFPGMNKVLQAAGRVIRTADDVGVVVLMDERFTTGAYRRMFPAEWSGSRLTDSSGIGDKVSRFWDEWL